MRRRRSLWAVADLPEELLTFDPDRWSLADWSAARRRWAEKHGWFGGSLAMLREERAVRRGEPIPPPDWPYWEPVGPPRV